MRNIHVRVPHAAQTLEIATLHCFAQCMLDAGRLDVANQFLNKLLMCVLQPMGNVRWR